MNRRELLKAGMAFGLASLVPSWLTKPRPNVIDLSPFCVSSHRRFALDRPFIQSNYPIASAEPFGLLHWKYATDTRVCVRVPAEPEDRDVGAEMRLPPASSLDWSHDRRRGWKLWPREDYLMASDTECPTCDGYGVTNPKECPTCDGFGCNECAERGCVGLDCPACLGRGIGLMPGIQRIGRVYVASGLDAKIRTLGECEYWLPPTEEKILFRFHGGLGLVATMNRAAAEKRIR